MCTKRTKSWTFCECERDNYVVKRKKKQKKNPRPNLHSHKVLLKRHDLVWNIPHGVNKPCKNNNNNVITHRSNYKMIDCYRMDLLINTNWTIIVYTFIHSIHYAVWAFQLELMTHKFVVLYHSVEVDKRQLFRGQKDMRHTGFLSSFLLSVIIWVRAIVFCGFFPSSHLKRRILFMELAKKEISFHFVVLFQTDDDQSFRWNHKHDIYKGNSQLLLFFFHFTNITWAKLIA